MPDPVRRPVLNPVLRFTKDPKPETITGGGKNAKSIMTSRLAGQRTALSQQFRELAKPEVATPRFGGHSIIYASMFEDSLAASWTPSDLFSPERGARLLTPFRTGYLVEVQTNQLAAFSGLVTHSSNTKDCVDISRVEVVRSFDSKDITTQKTLEEIWTSAEESEEGRGFIVWLMPFYNSIAAEELLTTVQALKQDVIQSPPNRLDSLPEIDSPAIPVAMRQSLKAAGAPIDRINAAMREYRRTRRTSTVVVVKSPEALGQLVASGTVFRIDPVQGITSTSPGDGREPDRPLPRNMSNLPIVGVVDGGLTASSYFPAQSWRAPPLIPNAQADTQHGNRVTSLIVQGHDWNNNLALPALYCQVGTAQAVPKSDTGQFWDPEQFIRYLDAVISSNPTTKVWNFSLNQKGSCDLLGVSYLGHEIALLARKHAILPVISVGNKPGDLLCPPADCEAAITVGGRMHSDAGVPSAACPISLVGPGPSSMLKPDTSHFSHVRAIGGTVIAGSSFATALTSPLAAHAMSRLRDATPDMVKALLLHSSDGANYDPAVGFGTPELSALPWECRPGFVTIQWKASLKPGASFYWDLPIPPSLITNGKLKGRGVLTAVLNPHPLVADYAGPNYFGARLETALQYEHGTKTKNLLGSMSLDKITEADARSMDHKWSPVRHHKREFQSVGFDGTSFSVYARIFARDLYLYGYRNNDEVPELDVVFALTIGTGDEGDNIYNELRDALGVFVEDATVDVEMDIEIDNEDE